MTELGVHSEVGKLRTVMVCRPGLAHQRLTPANCHELLYDDVIWVHEAQKDHFDFVLEMKEGRNFILDRRLSANAVGIHTGRALRPWLNTMESKKLAEHLIGGIAIKELPDIEGKSALLETQG